MRRCLFPLSVLAGCAGTNVMSPPLSPLAEDVTEELVFGAGATEHGFTSIQAAWIHHIPVEHLDRQTLVGVSTRPSPDGNWTNGFVLGAGAAWHLVPEGPVSVGLIGRAGLPWFDAGLFGEAHLSPRTHVFATLRGGAAVHVSWRPNTPFPGYSDSSLGSGGAYAYGAGGVGLRHHGPRGSGTFIALGTEMLTDRPIAAVASMGFIIPNPAADSSGRHYQD